MASTNKSQSPPVRKQVPGQNQGDLQRAIRETAGDVVKSAIFEKRPYLKLAFANPYNLSLFVGALAAAGLTLNPVLALIAVGVEALWLLHAPDSKRLRHILWDPRFDKIRRVVEAQERAERVRNLSEEDRARIERLVVRGQEIDSLAEQNPSFTGELLRSELVKTRTLVEAFVEMATTVNRYEQYLDTVDIDALEKDRERWHGRAANQRASEQERDVAKKNFAVIMKRIEKLREIRDYLSVARGQLDLIENSFQLIADQIVTMQSPAELTGQLDDLLDGVESIRQTAVDTEQILNTLGE